MKTISMDLEIYQNELKKEFEKGREECVRWISSQHLLDTLLSEDWSIEPWKTMKAAVQKIQENSKEARNA